ncbi:MAG TPA: PIG-L family deacetylase [Thermopolyspora sp.]
MTISGIGTVKPGPPAHVLPQARHVLAVIAHPGEESVILGGVLSAFRVNGARISVLSLTRGEATPCDGLERAGVVRPFELQMAAFTLAMTHVTIADFPDGMLSDLPIRRITQLIARQARQIGADLLLTVDQGADPADGGVTEEASRIACRTLGVKALTWTAAGPYDLDVVVSRDVQRCAMRAHRSQGRRVQAHLDRLAAQGDRERLRWLHR